MGLSQSKRIPLQRPHHTEVINALIELFGFEKYLEIGVSTGVNFSKAKAPFKIGVDPDRSSAATFKLTSDNYFKFSKETFDLIFIDGLHHADQVKKDFDNSLKRLNEGGLIVLHDTAPESEDLTSVPRVKRGRWLGDVYKFILKLNEYDGVDFRTLDFDNGITVAWRDGTNGFKVPDVDWNYYVKNRSLLRISTYDELIELLINPLKKTA